MMVALLALGSEASEQRGYMLMDEVRLCKNKNVNLACLRDSNRLPFLLDPKPHCYRLSSPSPLAMPSGVC
jgi:hypothetical protein